MDIFSFLTQSAFQKNTLAFFLWSMSVEAAYTSAVLTGAFLLLSYSFLYKQEWLSISQTLHSPQRLQGETRQIGFPCKLAPQQSAYVVALALYLKLIFSV